MAIKTFRETNFIVLADNHRHMRYQSAARTENSKVVSDKQSPERGPPRGNAVGL